MGIKVTVDDKRMKQVLGDISKRCKNLEPPLTGWGRQLVEQTKRQFETETDPDGEKWADLAPSTLKQKRKQGYPDKTLTRTGEMMESVGFEATAKTLSLKVGKNYAKWHQQGTNRLPKRKILGISSDRLNSGAGLVRAYIRGKR
jgi:phage virion morphogenesis protein